MFTKYTSPTAGAAPLAAVCARVSRGKSAPSTRAGGSIAQDATANWDRARYSAEPPNRRTSAMNAAGSSGRSESDTSESNPTAAIPIA